MFIGVITRKLKVFEEDQVEIFRLVFLLVNMKNINSCMLKRVDIKVMKWNGLVSGNLLVIRVVTR